MTSKMKQAIEGQTAAQEASDIIVRQGALDDGVAPDKLDKFMSDLGRGEAMYTPYTELEAIKSELGEPFDPRVIEFLPKGRNDNPKANALAYVSWNEYVKRLNRLAFGQWSTRISNLITVGEQAIVSVEVSIFNASHDDTSDLDNPTSAYATALKRACSKFGLGLYLYDMPREFLLKSTEFGKAFVEDNLSIAVRYYKAMGIPVSAEVEDELARAPKQTSTYTPAPSYTQATPTTGTGQGDSGKPTQNMINALVGRNRVPASVVDTLDFRTASNMMNDFIRERMSLKQVSDKYGFSLPADGLPIR